MKRSREGHAGEGPSNRKKQKKKEIAPYGNYHRYYGYRAPRQNDPRVDAMDPTWFKDGAVLDIGCNAGNVTLRIAAHFDPSHALGIDIDPRLIHNARKAMDRMVQSKLRRQQDSSPAASEEHTKIQENIKDEDLSSNKQEKGYVARFPQNIQFKTTNFVSEECSITGENQYDVILCLSVSKWIHLNWGDAGLMTLFTKTFQLLRPGGRFIFEPQPWDSYKKKKTVSETTKANFVAINIRPKDFSRVLLEEVGFEQVTELDLDREQRGSFSQRPVFVFTKPMAKIPPESE